LRNHYYHSEGQYNFNKSKWVQVLLGYDARSYSLYPDGNSFINPKDAGENLTYSRGGAFVQATKSVQEKLKLTASGRIDKVQYFDPKLTTRLGAVYTLADKHNLRFTFQNGYRFPTLLEAFSYLDNGGVMRLGGIPLMSKDQQIFENSYLKQSTDAFQTAVNADINVNGLTPDAAIQKNKGLLKQSDYTYIKPEHITSFEVGYKTVLFNNKVYVDADYYFNVYHDFIGQLDINKPNSGTIGVDDSTIYYTYDQAKYKKYRMWTNSQSITYNDGASLGVTYNFYRKFTLASNVSYANLRGIDSKDALVPAFNTPRWIVNVSFGNREIAKNVGFNVVWKWQDKFFWQNPLADGWIPSYNIFDAQVTYRVPKARATAKLGASNVFNTRYFQFAGGPTIGGLYYISVTLDGLLTK